MFPRTVTIPDINQNVSCHDVELVKIAGYMHDIGNAINRTHHAEYKPKIEKDRSVIALDLQIDESICFMYDYFESFLGRMMLCRKSAEVLGTTFKLTVNGRKVL